MRKRMRHPDHVRERAGVVLLICAALLGGAAAQGSESAQLRGAGSSLLSPLLRDWVSAFQSASPGAALLYEPSTEGEGLAAVRSGEALWSVGEVPLSPRDPGLRQLPLALVPVALVYNVPDAQGAPLRGVTLSRSAVARIYSRDIRTWADPALRELNPGVALPNLPIKLVVRSGSSGASAILSRALVSFGWTDTPGCQLGWGCRATSRMYDVRPGGERYHAAVNSSEVLSEVESTDGALGYLGAPAAHQGRLPLAIVHNSAEQPTVPSREFASQSAEGLRYDPDALTADAEDREGYPLLGLSYIRYGEGSCADRNRLLDFLHWVYTSEQAAARVAAHGLSPVSREVANRVLGLLQGDGCAEGPDWGLSQSPGVPVSVNRARSAALLHALGIAYHSAHLRRRQAAPSAEGPPVLTDGGGSDATMLWRESGEAVPDSRFIAIPFAAEVFTLVYNPGLSGVQVPLELPLSTIRAIFAGELRSWGDPRLSAVERYAAPRTGDEVAVCHYPRALGAVLRALELSSLGRGVRRCTAAEELDGKRVGELVRGNPGFIGIMPLSDAAAAGVSQLLPEGVPAGPAHPDALAAELSGLAWGAGLRNFSGTARYLSVHWVCLRRSSNPSGAAPSRRQVLAALDAALWLTGAAPRGGGDALQPAAWAHLTELQLVPLAACCLPPADRDAAFAEVTVDGVAAYPAPARAADAAGADDDETAYLWGMTAVTGLVVLLLVVGLCKHHKDAASIAALRTDSGLAEESAECIAALRLDELSYLRSLENPTPIERSFVRIMDLLTEYKDSIPAFMAQQTAGGEVSSAAPKVQLPQLESAKLRSALQCIIAQTQGSERAEIDELFSEQVRACLAAGDNATLDRLLSCGWDPPADLRGDVPSRCDTQERGGSIGGSLFGSAQGSARGSFAVDSAAGSVTPFNPDLDGGMSAVGTRVSGAPPQQSNGRFGDGAANPGNSITTVPLFPPGYEAPQAREVVAGMKSWHDPKGQRHWTGEAVDTIRLDFATCYPSAGPNEDAPCLWAYTVAVNMPFLWAAWQGRWRRFDADEARAREQGYQRVPLDPDSLLVAGLDRDPHAASPCATLLHESATGLRVFAIEGKPHLIRYENANGGHSVLSPLRDTAAWVAAPDRLVSATDRFSIKRTDRGGPPPGVLEFITSRDFNTRTERDCWVSVPVALEGLTRLREVCLAQKNQQRPQERICRQAEETFRLSPDALRIYGPDPQLLADAIHAAYKGKCAAPRPSPAHIAHATELGLLRWVDEWVLTALTGEPRMVVPLLPDEETPRAQQLWRVDCEHPDQPYYLLNSAMRHQQMGSPDAELRAGLPVTRYAARQPAAPPEPAAARFEAVGREEHAWAEWAGDGWRLTSAAGSKVLLEAEMHVLAWALPQYRAFIWRLDRALRTLPTSTKSRRKGYRGLANVTLDRRAYSRGRIVVFGAFTSSSADQGVASGFAAGDTEAAIFTMYGLTGRRISSWSRFGREKEVLYPPNTLHLVTEALSAEHAAILDKRKLQVFDLREVSISEAVGHLANEGALEVSREHPTVLGLARRAARKAERGDWVGAAQELLKEPTVSVQEQRFALPVLPHHSVGVIALAFNSPGGPEVGAGIDMPLWNSFFERAHRMATERGAHLLATHSGTLLVLHISSCSADEAAAASVSLACDLIDTEDVKAAEEDDFQEPRAAASPRRQSSHIRSASQPHMRTRASAAYETSEIGSAHLPRMDSIDDDDVSGSRPSEPSSAAMRVLELPSSSPSAHSPKAGLSKKPTLALDGAMLSTSSESVKVVEPRGKLPMKPLNLSAAPAVDDVTLPVTPKCGIPKSPRMEVSGSPSAGPGATGFGAPVRFPSIASGLGSTLRGLQRRISHAGSSTVPGQTMRTAPAAEQREHGAASRFSLPRSETFGGQEMEEDAPQLQVHCGVSVGTVHSGFGGCTGQRVEIADGPAVRRARRMATYSLHFGVRDVVADASCARAAQVDLTAWTTDLVAFDSREIREPIICINRGGGMASGTRSIARKVQAAWAAVIAAAEDGSDAATRKMQECISAVPPFGDTAQRASRALREAALDPAAYCCDLQTLML